MPGLAATLGLWAVGVQTHELIATVGAWGCAAVVGVELARRPRSSPAESRDGWLRGWWPLVAFLGWAVIAPTIAGSLPTATGVARLSDWLLLPVAAHAFAIATGVQRRRVAIAAAITMIASCFAAGLQHFGAWPPLDAFDGLEWTRVRFSRVYEAVPETGHRFMAGGLLFHRLKFANLTSLATVLALAIGLASTGRRRVLALGLAGVGLISVAVFPYARSALVTLVAGCGLVVLLTVRRRALALGLTAALVAATASVVVLSPSLRERFASATTAAGSGERGALLATGIAAVEAHPLTGVGPGRFHPALYAEADAPSQVIEHEGKAHNQIVSLAAEVGIPGAALFLVLLGWLATAYWRGRPESVGPLAALVVFALLGFTHDPLFHAEFSLGFVLVCGLGVAQAQMEPSAAPFV